MMVATLVREKNKLMRKKWKMIKGGILLLATLLVTGELGQAAVWAMQIPDVRQSVQSVSSGNAGGNKAGDTGINNILPEGYTVSSGDKRLARAAAIWNPDLGNTTAITNANVAKWWKDGMVPTSFTERWIPNVPAEGKFQLSVETVDGSPAVHCHSEDGSARYCMMNTKLTGIDYAKKYVLRAYVKTENVAGTGFYMRAQAGKKVNVNMGDGYKVRGTSDGWVLYEITLKDLAALAQDDSGRMKIEVFFEKFTGDVWVKDIMLLQDYDLSMNQQTVRMNIGESTTLEVQASEAGVDLDGIIWTSSDDSIAVVDNGVITAKKGGSTVITASLEDGHSAACRVLVSDGAMEQAYAGMRDKWTERLTGNSFWNNGNASKAYQSIVQGYDKAAKEALDVFVGDSNSQLFRNLDLTLKTNSGSTNSKDSADLAAATSRILEMARAWACEGSGYYHNEELRDNILYALEWVYKNIYNESIDNKTRYGNWYHWWISMPQNLAGAAILMYDELDTPENEALLQGIAATLKNFNEDPAYVYKVRGAGSGKMDMTGANLAETCLVAVLRSALARDQEGAALAVSYFGRMVAKVSSGDGIYEDGSFIQHNNLAYTGGYGATLLNGAEKIVYLTTGSSLEIETEQLDVIYNWIWDGIRPLYADGAVFDMVSGRSVARPGRSDLTTGRGILAGVVLMAKSAPEEFRGKLQAFARKHLMAGVSAMGEEAYYGGMNAAAMMEALKITGDSSIVPEDDTPYAYIFGSMDKAVAHSETFSAGFSFSSGRTGRFEYGNGENAKGWHQSDGMVYIYNGDPAAYSDNYWNTIDSHRLPGITTDHSTWKLSAWGNYPGNGNYNGGAVLGQYAAIAMNFKNYTQAANDKLTAKKTWFVFDDEIVCLGAGISGMNASMDTETIVDNKKVDGGNALLINGTAYTTENDTNSLEQKVSWAWLEGNTDKDAMGYYFPSQSNVYVKREARTGSWRDVNNGNTAVDAAPVTRNYVSLALKHGEYINGKTASFQYENYDYVLLPGRTAEEAERYSQNPDIEILANNAYVQAAWDKKADVYGYVFWQPSASSNKLLRVGDVESDYASVVLQRDKQNKTITVGIADPLQNRDKVTVRLYGNHLKLTQADSNITVVKTDKYGVVLDVATRNAKNTAFQAVFSYEEQDEAAMEQYRKIRVTYADNLTGNSFTDKTDKEYTALMADYTRNAREVWDSLIKEEDRTRLWEDLNVTLDYSNKGSNNNDSVPFDTTVERIRTMALAYASEGSSLYHNKQLGQDIKGTITFILDNYPRELADKVYGNWWNWDIGIPQKLCDITLLLYDELRDEMISDLYRYLDTTVPFADYCWMRSTRPYLYATTAANTMDIGVVRALTGAIGNDPKGLYMASDVLPSLLKYVTSGDGFYRDGSYAQHGTLAYTGGYGADAIRGVAKIASITNGTPWACTDADPNIVYEWILNAFRPLYVDGGIFEMVTGRQISRYNRNDITTGRYIMDAILLLAESAPEQYRDRILSFAKTQVAAGAAYDKDAYFGRLRFSSLITAKKLLADTSIPVDSQVYTKIYAQMDKAVIHGDGYALGISMYSSRKANAECGNNENFRGWYTSDGMTSLYNKDQHQYNDNYWATVDMTRLAGITTNHVTGNLGNFSLHVSPNAWVGASSARELYASIGMDFSAQFSDLKARKSWFVLGDQIVALGAGITSTEGDYTETIVENRKIDNNNTLITDGREATGSVGVKDVDTISWAWLSANKEGGAIGYYFPESTRVIMLREDRTGKWQDVNTNARMMNEETAQEITRSYLSLAIDHGIAPENADYSYVLLPGKTLKEMDDYAQNNSIRILANTDTLQAVCDTELQVCGYNFWKAGTYTPIESNMDHAAYVVEAKQPASITIAEEAGVITIGIADPTQKAGSVTVEIGMDSDRLKLVSQAEGVTVNIGINGKAVITANTQKAYGATFQVVLADKEAAAAIKLLQETQDFLESNLTMAEESKLIALQAGLKELDLRILGKSDRERAEKLLMQVDAVVHDMKAANAAVSALQGITVVDKDNVDTVTVYLETYDNLTASQKAMLTASQTTAAEAVRNLLKAYQDTIKAVGGEEGENGNAEDNKSGSDGDSRPGDSSENKPGDGSDKKSGDGSENKPGNGSDKKSGDSTENKLGDSSENKPGDGSDKKSGDGSDKKSSDNSENKSGDNSENKSGESSENKSGDNSDKKPGDNSDKKPGDNSDKKPGDNSDKKPGAGSENKSGDSSDKKPGDSSDKKPGDSSENKSGDNSDKKSEASAENKSDDNPDNKPESDGENKSGSTKSGQEDNGSKNGGSSVEKTSPAFFDNSPDTAVQVKSGNLTIKWLPVTVIMIGMIAAAIIIYLRYQSKKRKRNK